MNVIPFRYAVLLLMATAVIPSEVLAQSKARDSVQVKIGYTREDRRTMTGSAVKVGAEQMKKGLMTSAIEALNGQAAGVQVQTGGNQEVMVSAVRVRGTTSLTGGNDPLVIIDNVASDLATLSTIYPADIESFTILKDAAETSQYGSRGASGVIQVTTKKGHGGKFHISYDGSFGVESVYKKLHMLSADQYRAAAEKMGLGLYDGGNSTNFQDVILFNTSILENIRVGKKDATDEEVIEAAKLAECDEFVQKLPDGYDTVIGENGELLSGGQRQRISIARAMLKDANVILLDEATSFLDVENESKIQKALSELIKNKTVIIIAHRMRTIANADKIIVLDEGRISEQGSPEELLAQNGLFKKMVDLQNLSGEWVI